MSLWTPLNVIQDDADDEVDDTRELQIEEALKLYQHAIKLHAQGAAYFKETTDAYETLFKSEIFRYNESPTGAEEGTLPIQELDATDDEHDDLGEGLMSTVAGSHAVADSSPSTLSQILHLSHKNRGQLELDRLQHSLANSAEIDEDPEARKLRIEGTLEKALLHFAEALRQDESDIELWRRTARVATALGKQRIARLCLESALTYRHESALSTNPGLSMSIEQTLAREQLDQLSHGLMDLPSEVGMPIGRAMNKRLPQLLKDSVDPYPLLPSTSEIVPAESFNPLGPTMTRYPVECATRTWAGLGKALLEHLDKQQGVHSDTSAPAGVSIVLPGGENEQGDGNAPVSPPRQTQGAARSGSKTSDKATAPSGDGNQQTENSLDEPSTANTEAQRPASPEPEPEPSSKGGTAEPQDVTPAPSKKRTPSAAGLPETADSGRVRSKRIRAREAATEVATGDDKPATESSKQGDVKSQDCAAADDQLFGILAQFLKDFEVETTGDLSSLRAGLSGSSEAMDADIQPQTERSSLNTAVGDLYAALQSWNKEKQKALVDETGPRATFRLGGALPPATDRLAVFVEHAGASGRTETRPKETLIDHGLPRLVRDINRERLHVTAAAIAWLLKLLSFKTEQSQSESSKGDSPVRRTSSYLRHRWPEPLKEAVMEVLDRVDSLIFKRLRHATERVMDWFEGRGQGTDEPLLPPATLQTMHLLQTIFELHLDCYSNPSIATDKTIVKDRIHRWASLMDRLAYVLFHCKIGEADDNTLTFRYLWATALASALSEEDPRAYTVQCMNHLKRFMQNAGNPVVELPNNATMPEVSISAAAREISKLESHDYFLEIFQDPPLEPILIIERLEPVLDQQAIGVVEGSEDLDAGASTDAPETRNDVAVVPQDGSVLGRVMTAIQFLKERSTSLRVYLWMILSDAYEAIDYSTKVLSCNLRCIEVIVAELKSSFHLTKDTDERTIHLLRWLRIINNLLSKTITIAINYPTAFECIDEEHLKTSMASIAFLACLSHTASLFEDQVRVGRFSPAEVTGHVTAKLRLLATNKLRELQMRTWLMLYTLIREGFVQILNASKMSSEHLSGYLSALHRTTGLRSFCDVSNHTLLKILPTELGRLGTEQIYELELQQVLFDLYGFKFGPNSAWIEDHGCHAQTSDRRGVTSILGTFLHLVKKASLKDLSKPEYKSAIDKIREGLAPVKLPKQAIRNMRVMNEFLKSSIHPRDLYQSIKGVFDIPSVQVAPEASKVAKTGWYYFVGETALLRFRSQKRSGPGSRDDLSTAAQFLKYHLENNMDSWKAWYRLAQTYDSILEEEILWSADKINSGREELNGLQRTAIHCYTMAVAGLGRALELSAAAIELSSDLYSEFGMRIYASTRAPFDMDVFRLESRFNALSGSEVYERLPHPPLSEFSAWKFACILFARALIGKPEHWMNHFMRGKCLWKMYNHPDNVGGSDGPIVGYMDVTNCFVRAIETLPERKSEKQDPVFEPHYKLVSIVNKLVGYGHINVVQANRILEITPYVKKANPASDKQSWKGFMLQVLEILRGADKANWHHRMTARMAHLLYDDDEEELSAAQAARRELTKQIFTKTMSILVWKPEPGRHFVYTSRYTIFFAGLLLQLDDKASLEALLKRVRKKSSEFYEHPKVWAELSEAYIQLLRRSGDIRHGQDEVVFKSMLYENMQAGATKVHEWCHKPTTTHPILDILREAIDLKKLNSNLIKPYIFEELIADTFATLYERVLPKLLAAEFASKTEANRELMKVDNLLGMQLDGACDEIPSTIPTLELTLPGTIRHRPKTITRREILRKAEIAVIRVGLPPAITIVTKQPAETDHDHDDDGDGDGDDGVDDGDERNGRSPSLSRAPSPET
ncbi:MAG: Signal peptidase complex catalytic subunit [Watsoniomyces obsoletus]|nr:MAG: Signal peptidase complex catalytic subunit [Watsoniomyces obsoletus]